ncbi:phosphatase PAP2 family protein [Dysgonomonas macrotermitis]|uniref:Undecaprenyl-diphosphatase n=1 Tax=Dysgonomonas macrotermitis TaxID=1346286 RepID=A0A1M5HRK8_9BACT|nr:phosphatase PAP2 family protein [Dysgonomonas macrotermitis]SHG18604.1 undecaprenyl-diphosphatase [Dysgonomonas macrotermitis]
MIGNDTEAERFVEGILPYERDAFLWLNEVVHNIFWDSFMWIYSGKITWVPLVIVALFVFIYKVKWKEAAILIFCMVLLATLCDQLSAGVVKHIFERLRPTHHPDFKDFVIIVNDYRGGRFGFVSAHATNGFGVATFLALVFKYRRFTCVIFSWALITAYSRIYLGVHFISDIIGGMILGSILGFLVYLLFQFCRIKILHHTPEQLRIPLFSRLRANILCLTIVIIVITIFIISLLNFIFGFSWFF